MSGPLAVRAARPVDSAVRLAGIALIGVNHLQGLPDAVLTAHSVPRARQSECREALAALPGVTEVVLLTTCHRTEAYVCCDNGGADARRIADVLGAHAGVGDQHQYRMLMGRSAIAHLFRVAAGLESALLGEQEVLDQVRRAWRLAARQHTAGRQLARLGRYAVTTGLAARDGDQGAFAATPLAQAALDAMACAGIELRRARVLVVGAGPLAGDLLRAAHDVCPELVVMTPSDRPLDLSGLRCRQEPWHQWREQVLHANVLVLAAGAGTPLLRTSDLAAGVGACRVIIDVSDPPALVNDAPRPDVLVLDLREVRRSARSAPVGRQDLDRVECLVRQRVLDFAAKTDEELAAPLIASLHEHAELVREEQLRHNERMLTALDPEHRRAVERLTKDLIAKLLHTQTAALRAAASSPNGACLAEFTELVLGEQSRQPSRPPMPLPPQENTHD